MIRDSGASHDELDPMNRLGRISVDCHKVFRRERLQFGFPPGIRDFHAQHSAVEPNRARSLGHG